MVRVSKETIYRKMEELDLPYYQVFDGKQKVDENQTDENTENAIQDLRTILDDLEGNSVTVKVSNRNSAEKAKGGRGYEHYEYTVKLTATRTEANGNISLLKELYELKNQMQIDRLTNEFEKKLAEATKKDKDSPADRALVALLPAIQKAFLGQNTPGIAGIGEEVKEANLKGASVKEIRTAIIKSLMTSDPTEYLEVLAAIATIAEKKPTEYATYKPMLIALAKNG